MKKNILISGIGTSPAVLTETVWCLAHQSVPVVPDEVVVLTTESGKERLYAEILNGESSVWRRMCESLREDKVDIDGKLVFGKTSVRVIPDAHGNEIYDLRSGEDNLRAADFMLQQLRQYTESSDTVVLASIAGGRKTLSALLFSCMTLLGREDDRVFHVLLPPEFEGGVTPPMYYPVKGVTYTNRMTGKTYKSEKFQSELFEVPFVRMRGWYQEKFKTIPPTYRTLVSRVKTVAPPAIAYPEIEIDAWNGWVKIDGKFAPMSKACFAMLLLLADGCPTKDLHGKLLALHKQPGVAKCDWLASFQEGSRFADENCLEDVYKVQSELRKKLRSAGFAAAESLVPQRGNPVVFPLAKVRWRSIERLADIRGYLAGPLVG